MVFLTSWLPRTSQASIFITRKPRQVTPSFRRRASSASSDAPVNLCSTLPLPRPRLSLTVISTPPRQGIVFNIIGDADLTLAEVSLTSQDERLPPVQ